MTRVALIDHGAGNLRSVRKALEAVGGEVEVTNVAERILDAEKVVLPGVGAFSDVMRGVEHAGLVPVLGELVARETPLLGICVGMQLLFEYSEEFGRYEGLGFLPGEVLRFETPGLKIPQTGWNSIFPTRSSPLLSGLPADAYAYFNHSFYCRPAEFSDILATTDYGFDYASMVERRRVYGVQFHPEKSQQVGLTILRNFIKEG